MSTKGHEGARRKSLQGHILGCTRRAGENTFLSTKGHEGARRKPLQGHILVCTRRAGKNTFLSTKGHEGPRRGTKGHEENLCKVIYWAVHEGRGRTPFCPRRAAKGHEENLCKVMYWSVHEGRGRTPFCPRRATKGHEENLCKNIIWAVREGRWKTPFCPRRGTKKIFCGGRGSWSSTKRIRQETVRFCPRATCFSHCVSSLVQVSREPGKHQWIGDSG